MEILTGIASKKIDEYCIRKLEIPSIILMERAAYSLFEEIQKDRCNNEKICVLCGVGNNGGDGLALARILYQSGVETEIFILGNLEKASDEFNIQYCIIKNMGINVSFGFKEDEFDKNTIIVDGIFGIGLSRNITGEYAELINKVNKSGNKIIAIDIPSGLCANKGIPMGETIKAYKTVTFGYIKAGLVLFQGKKYSGEIVVKDIGFDYKAYKYVKENYNNDVYNAYSLKDISIIKDRDKTSNKGTYGKVTVIAGSDKMFGAAFFAAASAYKCGAGLVEIYTHKNNINLLKTKLPEGIVYDYEEDFCITKDSIVVIGPGLGKSDVSRKLVKKVLLSKAKTIIDADALNIISDNKELLLLFHENIIITPHIKEMSRIINEECENIRKNIVEVAREFSGKYKCITVIKDATTIISDSNGQITINLSGNSGMSTGGSGDVLTGIISGMISQKLSIYEATCMGVYLHGLSGDYAKEKKSEYGMIASDIVESIPEILKLR